MKILSGALEPTYGNVLLTSNEHIGKLHQEQSILEEFTEIDTVIVPTGGLSIMHLFESSEEHHEVVNSWDLKSGDIALAKRVLIYDERGDRAC